MDSPYTHKYAHYLYLCPNVFYEGQVKYNNGHKREVHLLTALVLPPWKNSSHAYAWKKTDDILNGHGRTKKDSNVCKSHSVV